MRSRNVLLPARLPAISALVAIVGLVLVASPVSAASALVQDGNTIKLGNVTYRLNGIDAPELDQTVSQDHHAAPIVIHRLRLRALEPAAQMVCRMEFVCRGAG